MIDVMGHELRTPITIVRNALLMMDTLKRKSHDMNSEKIAEYIDMAVESARREIGLIEIMLSATKVEASRIQVGHEKIDMLDVINDAIEGQRVAIKTKNLKLMYTKPEEQYWGYADRIRIQEVMDNLLNNAVKYTSKGTVEIKIQEKDEFVQISVIDSGMGIAQADIPNLGKKFFRAKQYTEGDKTTESIVRPGGTGLGLYVVFGLVKAMGGEIYIESELGKGSTFSFTTPKYAGQKEEKVDEKFEGKRKSVITVDLNNKDKEKEKPKPETQIE